MSRIGFASAFVCFSLALFSLSGCGPSNAELIQRSRQSYVDTHPNLETTVKSAILRGDLVVGMSKEEVVAVCGQPSHQTLNIVPGGGVKAGWTFCGRNVFFGPDDKVAEVSD